MLIETGIAIGRQGLAPYAVHGTRGRLHPESASPTRSPFQRDRDRIIHSSAFRRLKHKTQVFVFHEGDHYRTRLTHSIEVAQIARSLARALRCDEDLAEALALSHDLGHTPFGHVGEDVLDELMAAHGGFDHNAQALRVVTMLERRYAEFDGLNLCWETLEGLVKHNGPLLASDGSSLRTRPLDASIRAFDAAWNLDLAGHSSLEAQCAAIADDIAYDAHDIDDGLRAGLIELDALADVALIGGLLAEVRARYPGLDPHRTTHEIVRRQITAMVEDAIAESMRRIGEARPLSDAQVRRAGRPLVAFGERMAGDERAIKDFLFATVYRAPSVMRVRAGAADVLRDLFDAYLSRRAALPDDWACQTAEAGDHARQVADFLAGMTDRYALGEHRRLFDHTPDLR